jgi:hypothetical protein
LLNRPGGAQARVRFLEWQMQAADALAGLLEVLCRAERVTRR